MLEKMIMLDNLGSVRDFADIAGQKDYLIELSSGGKRVNGNSIEEIFTLDLTKPIKMTAHCEMVAEISRQIEQYIIKNK